MLGYFATLADAGTMISLSSAGAAVDPGNLSDAVIDRYLNESDPQEPTAAFARSFHVSELVRQAHTLQPGSLRDRLFELSHRVAKRE